ncbi:hypothetical protein IIE18_10455 [Pseudomonas sp. V1]|uniref:hypothetical protein n=1 Tax=Pseudomonas arcuscaelestis TaxID=2710591 RepID=UPI00193FA498|nr:hypothetical protein [Pseudomonas arcuscaelestis]MBM3105560.1 hypothetical protein [Pseudomonas arcuscaelestis]
MQLLTTDHDIRLTADQLEQKYSPAGGGQHPTFTRADWRIAVENDDTISGYWAWVQGEILSLVDDSMITTGEVVQPAAADLVPDVQPVKKLHFVATIHGFVDMNDGETGSPSVTEMELTHQISDSISTMIGNGGLTGDTPAVIGHYAVDLHVGQSLSNKLLTVDTLRQQGCAVVLFNAEELGGALPEDVEERLVELGNEAIPVLAQAG